MKRAGTYMFIVLLVLLSCVVGAQTQSFSETTPGTSSASDIRAYSTSTIPINPESTVEQYSQYYSMPTGPVSSNVHITAPEQFPILGSEPSSVYLSQQQMAIPYSQVRDYAPYVGGSSLWIQGTNSWTQYALVPQGSVLSLLATSATGGNGYLYEIYPDGKLSKNYYISIQIIV
jgi:hypothetical protein